MGYRFGLFRGARRVVASGVVRLRGAFLRFLSDERGIASDSESGQAVVEYILILTVTVAGAGLISRQVIKTLDTGVVKLGAQLEKDLKTGRAPVDIWKN